MGSLTVFPSKEHERLYDYTQTHWSTCPRLGHLSSDPPRSFKIEFLLGDASSSRKVKVTDLPAQRAKTFANKIVAVYRTNTTWEASDELFDVAFDTWAKKHTASSESLPQVRDYCVLQPFDTSLQLIDVLQAHHAITKRVKSLYGQMIMPPYSVSMAARRSFFIRRTWERLLLFINGREHQVWKKTSLEDGDIASAPVRVMTMIDTLTQLQLQDKAEWTECVVVDDDDAGRQIWVQKEMDLIAAISLVCQAENEFDDDLDIRRNARAAAGLEALDIV